MSLYSWIFGDFGRGSGGAAPAQVNYQQVRSVGVGGARQQPAASREAPARVAVRVRSGNDVGRER